MKALARSFVWWPGIDKDIEDTVRACEMCCIHKAPSKVPLLTWPCATSPWQRIHFDFAEVKGQQFFIVVDSHSKWSEVIPMSTTTSSGTFQVLRSLFARYGLLFQLVFDK